MKKLLAVVGGGTAAVALGAGLFAWQASVVNVSNVVAAGTSGAVVACTTDDLDIVQGAAFYNGTNWAVTSATVSNSGANGAEACVGMKLTLTAVDSSNTPIASGFNVVAIDVNGDFNENVTVGPTPVNMSDLAYWTVVINAA